MTIVLILVAVALLVTFVVYQFVRGFAGDVRDPEQLIGRTQPIDLPALLNLTDPAEDDFLRRRLPRRLFYRVRRERSRATIVYVQMAAHNAALLVRLGQGAQGSANLQIRQAGAELLSMAVRTRILTGMALVQLYIAVILPWWQPRLKSLRQTYAVLRRALGRVVSWQRPDLAGSIGRAV